MQYCFFKQTLCHSQFPVWRRMGPGVKRPRYVSRKPGIPPLPVHFLHSTESVTKWSLSLSFSFCKMAMMTSSWPGYHEDLLSNIDGCAVLIDALSKCIHLILVTLSLGRRPLMTMIRGSPMAWEHENTAHYRFPEVTITKYHQPGA